jgi:hypothetical protein
MIEMAMKEYIPVNLYTKPVILLFASLFFLLAPFKFLLINTDILQTPF